MHRLEAMDTFTRVVACGSFAAAAQQLELSRAVITKRIFQLEEALGAKLLNRTTRRLSLTEIGRRYHGFCLRMLDEMQREERDIARLQQEPYGELKVMAPKSFGSLHMGQAIAGFVASYPEITVALTVADISLRSLDPIEHGVDLAIRLVDQPNSRLYSRRIGTVRWIVCGTPDYLERAGEPTAPVELSAHACILHRTYAADGIWRLRGPDGAVSVKVAGPVTTNSVLATRAAVLEGCGIGILPTYCVAADIAGGRLRHIMKGCNAPDQSICAVYPHARSQPRKLRLFVDYMAERFRQPSWERYLPS